MAKVAITEQYLEDIADAIREKTGLSSATFLPSQMAPAILTISGGGGIIPTGTLNITSNNTYDVTQYATAVVDVPTGSTINNQDKTVSPTKSQQNVTFDSGYTGLGVVTVNAIPASYIIPSGNISITENGTNIDVSTYATASVNVSGGGTTINNQTKSATPSESQQVVTYDNGYTGLESVTIGAISSTYVGSGITRRASSDLSASGATITVPAGYYEAEAEKSVNIMTLPTSAASSATSGYTSKATIGRSTSAQYINIPTGYNSVGAYYIISATPNGSATGPTSLSGSSATVSTGTNTLTLTKTNVTTTPTVSAGYVSSATASTATVALTASVTTKAAATITPSTTAQTIAAGTYLTGTQTVSGDSNLVASNIVNGVSIFGVTGNVVLQTYYTGSSVPASSLGQNGDLYLQT